MLRAIFKGLPVALLIGGFMLLGAGSCKEETKTSLSTEAAAFTREGLLQLYRGQSDTLLREVVIEIAETEYETQTGLMYREHMDNGAGMLFIFPEESMHSFYMKNTLIPLDILFIRSDLSIANIARNAKPLDERSIPSSGPVQYVLELNAGMCDRWGVVSGDRIEFRRDTEK